MGDESTAVITLREVYDVVLELKTELASVPRMTEDHEIRIRDLERKVWSYSSISALLAVVISQVVSTLIK
jgi:hypothetical protein